MIDRFLELLSSATARIEPHYFQLPMAGEKEEIYRERVYCYELYHQLRILPTGEKLFSGYALSGEIDKRGHPIIRPCAPDLALHSPGKMDNLVLVEVKPVNGTMDGIEKDLNNLAYFVSSRVRYQLGVHLVYGHDEKLFGRFERSSRHCETQGLQLFWHQECGKSALCVR